MSNLVGVMKKSTLILQVKERPSGADFEVRRYHGTLNQQLLDWQQCLDVQQVNPPGLCDNRRKERKKKQNS